MRDRAIKSISNRLFFFPFIFFLCCNCKTQSPHPEAQHLLRSYSFDKQSLSTFANQVNLGVGMDGNGLDLEKTAFIPALTNADTTWFSQDRDFSVAVWVKSSKQNEDTSIIISNADFRKQDAGIYGQRRTKSGFTLYSYQGAWGWNIGNGEEHYLYEPIAMDQPIADGRWHHLAFSYHAKQKEVRLFYDGINKAIIHIGDLVHKDFISDLPLRIGARTDTATYASFPGMIDELQVWDIALSPGSIKKLVEKYVALADEPELEKDELTVVNWNIWHGGTHFLKERDGFDGIERTIELIENAEADIVLMQETYGAGSQISSSLGFYYYEAASTIGAVWGANLSVMSRYPLEAAYMVEEKSNYGNNYAFNNGGVKIKLSSDKKVLAFTNWYNRGKPEDLEGALNAWEGLIQKADSVPIIFGGDFNSVSHLDDGEGKSDHSKLMTSAGFKDAFRTFYPNVEKHPGYSNGGYTSRIDYIYFIGNKLKLLEAGPIVPHFKGQEVKTPDYPSDHLGVVAKFKIN